MNDLPSSLAPNVRTCVRCIMDETAKDITFDDQGVCNYCTGFLEKQAKYIALDEDERQRRLGQLVDMVKRSGRGKRYDCIVGLSGGVDSSWSLVKAVELGLRPLAVHMDSGWNSELAQNNIANLVRTLGVDLHTHVIDWPEIRGLMEAFFAADVIDVEVLPDNALLAVNYQQAASHGLKYILAGTNIATEGVDIPKGWNWYKSDKRNIVGISKRFGGPKLRSFPSISTLGMARYVLVNGIRWVSFLDYLDYKKLDALETLKRDYGYKPYPHKHWENVFTRFYQGYLQPFKFGVDKRKPHLSSLIMNGEISRDEALSQAQGIAYGSDREMEADRLYFIKKMGWSDEKFDDYMRRPEKPHDLYPSEAAFSRFLLNLYRKLNLRVGKLVWSGPKHEPRGSMIQRMTVGPKDVQQTLGGEDIHKQWVNEYRTDDVEPLLQVYFQYLVKRLGLHRDMRILDAGCGTAFQSIRLAKMGFSIDGIDYSDFAVAEARRSVEASGVGHLVSVRQGDITSLDIPDDSYDAILCLAVLMHVPDIDAAVKELARVLKLGGILLIAEENRDAPEYWLHRLYWRFGKKQNVRVEHHEGYTNAWMYFGAKRLFTRAVSADWVIRRFEQEGLEFQWKKSAIFTGLYARLKGVRRRALLKLNYGWFRFGGPARMAVGNYLAFKKEG
jgi:N-acetyl sugar amidotransferase